jgi:hypothetical protein
LPDQFERSGNYWKRLMLGSLCLIVIAAGATSVAGWNEIDRITDAFEQGKQLKLERFLEPAESGEPQTIMLIGSDKRAESAIGGSGGARSDTIILVRPTPTRGRRRSCRCRATSRSKFLVTGATRSTPPTRSAARS